MKHKSCNLETKPMYNCRLSFYLPEWLENIHDKVHIIFTFKNIFSNGRSIWIRAKGTMGAEVALTHQHERGKNEIFLSSTDTDHESRKITGLGTKKFLTGIASVKKYVVYPV